MARSWAIPPWLIEHPERPPTEAEVSRWFFRTEIRLKLGI